MGGAVIKSRSNREVNQQTATGKNPNHIISEGASYFFTFTEAFMSTSKTEKQHDVICLTYIKDAENVTWDLNAIKKQPMLTQLVFPLNSILSIVHRFLREANRELGCVTLNGFRFDNMGGRRPVAAKCGQ